MMQSPDCEEFDFVAVTINKGAATRLFIIDRDLTSHLAFLSVVIDMEANPKKFGISRGTLEKLYEFYDMLIERDLAKE